MKRFRSFTSPDEVLNVSGYLGSVVSKCEEPVITNMNNVKLGELYAMKFNAATSKIDLGASDSLVGDLTAWAWINPWGIGEGGAGRIVTNSKFIFAITSPNNKQIFISSDGGGTFKYSANDIWAYNKWYHIVVTRTAVGLTNIYVDTVINGAVDETSGTPEAGVQNTVVGNDYTGGTTWNGLIGEVRIVKKILTANEISQIFSNKRRLYNK